MPEIPYFERLLWNVYIVDRNKTTFEYAKDVPHFVPQMVPIFLTLFICEEIFHFIKYGTKNFRPNDSVTSVALGLMFEIARLFTRGTQAYGYVWLYQYRIFDFDWQSPWTWWTAALMTDLCFYWLHRATHEISILWCTHQVHHSSEEYNLSTALRQSVLQYMITNWIYLICAFVGVPLAALLVHQQLNLFYQYWIHTEMIGNLGPLEWILNTASHHRVHHGVNKYCLDKNYAGFLIIWDRMFGTFEPERPDEKIVYGLIDQPQTFNPIYLQLYYFKLTYNKAISMKTWADFFKTFFYGPGWHPGTLRLGDENANPEKTPDRTKYNPILSTWIQCYLLSHFAIVVLVHQILTIRFATFDWLTILSSIAFVFFSLYTIGCTFNGYWFAALLESVRCIGTVAIILQHPAVVIENPTINSALIVYFSASALIWCSSSMTILKSMVINDKLKGD